MYAKRLQTQLQALQEKNRLLRNANGLSPVGNAQAGGPNHLLENIEMDQQEPEKSPPPYKSPDSSTKDD